jgi:hypothetical protein
VNDKYHIKNFGRVLVSKSVILDRQPVVEMIRGAPMMRPGFQFSGWAFGAGKGEEDDFDYYSVRSLLAADPSVEPFLDERVGSRFRRNGEGAFERIPFND